MTFKLELKRWKDTLKKGFQASCFAATILENLLASKFAFMISFCWLVAVTTYAAARLQMTDLGVDEWTDMLVNSKKLMSICRLIFDDIQLKYSSNVRNEFICELYWMKRFDWTLKFNVTEYSCSWDCNVFTRAGQSPTTCDLCAGIPGMHFELDDVHFGFQKGE